MMIEYIKEFFVELVNILGEMSPYLLLGFFFAGVLHVIFPNESVKKFFGKSKFGSAVNASLFGIPLPLCSCGVIPTGLSLYKNGASKGSTVSFLISTPQTGVDSILVTYSLLGLPFAIIRPIIAFITGVFGGFFTNHIDSGIKESENQTEAIVNEPKNWQQKFLDVFRYGFVEFLQDISKWLVIGLLLAAVISIIIPDSFFSGTGLSPIIQMLIILVASIPLYICATASVPLAAVLILKGVSPGAALVLLMAGPATNAATITMIAKVMGKKALFSYLFSIIGGALIFGLVVDYLLPEQWFQLNPLAAHAHEHDVLPSWLKLASGVILVLLLLYGFIKKNILNRSNNKANNISMGEQVIKVEGMTCNHCKANVEKNLNNLSFIDTVEIDLASGKVNLEGENLDYKVLEETINGLGYKYMGKEE